MSAPLIETPVAILAGGLATRLRPRTETIPKSLLPVAGRPFLSHQLDWLHSQGIRNVVLCVGYLGEQIEEQFEDGTSCGMQLQYSFDGNTLLGTGGAIKKALPLLGKHFFVLYGDSYLPIPWGPVLESFRQSGKDGLMTVFHNEGRYDTSNVWFESGSIKVYDKRNRLPEMRHIDYGLSLLDSGVFDAYPVARPFDLAQVMGALVSAQQLAGYEVSQRFYEIGSPEGLQELESLLSQSSHTFLL